MAASVLPMFERYRRFYGREPDSRAEAFLRSRLERDQSVVFIAAPEVAPEQAAGFAQLYPSYSSLSLASIWILNDLYVEPGYRRAGIGRLLTQHAVRFARDSGAASITLQTARSNQAAKDLYTSLGFQRETDFAHYTIDLPAADAS